MYVAVKGGEAAIDSAHQLLAEKRRGDLSVAELSVKQIQQQLSLAVDRVMTEGSLYDTQLAALAIKQAMGDTVEAIFLLRAYRTTLPRFSYSEAINTDEMRIERRISATYKDIPGGQALGPTFDYTHRLLDFSLLEEGSEQPLDSTAEVPANTKNNKKEYNSTENISEENNAVYPRVTDFLRKDNLLQQQSLSIDENASCTDLTREPLSYPADRTARLQALTRADEGYLLALGYSTQRGYGRTHPFAGEIRMGQVMVSMMVEELGFAIDLGEICVTECDMINQFLGNQEQPPQFTQGYGISFGFCERKTMAMALVDRSLQAKELGEAIDTPAAQEEFVLSHCDNVESSGFVSHLKLPHYVDFQSELALVRQMRADYPQTSGDDKPEATQASGASNG
ncbi:MAG: alpha-D-ribose 1-methylphosphonate 5-triphosphate synthase subunit PhnI [Candidatus Endobugula sp.]|jgi:alpha-D-ribose 1-methylphosphonate 5-triphosphate synthase subunit PhnI